MENDELLFSSRGGLRDGWLNVTWPFVRMRLFRERIELGWKVIRKADIQSVSRYEGWFSSGIRIVWGAKNSSVIFWTWDPVSVLMAFQANGYIQNSALRDVSARSTRYWLAATMAIVLAVVMVTLLSFHFASPDYESLESRRDFHKRQLEFKEICKTNQILKRDAREAYRYFSGFPTLAPGGLARWKEFPCSLVIRDGKIAGVFYHDYPFKSQPLPPRYSASESCPYFEKYPEYLTDEYIGSWLEDGSFVFQKKPSSSPVRDQRPAPPPDQQ